MDQFIDVCVAGLNGIGWGFCSHAAAMFVQIGVLVAVLLALDIPSRHRVRATVRYWIWMLVFVKLLLPPSLAMPTGIGYWCGGHVPLPAVVALPGPAPSESPSVPAEVVPMPVSAGPDSGDAVPEPRVSPLVAPKHLTWQGIVFLLWGSGLLVFAGLVVRRVLFVRRLMAQGSPAPDEMLDLLDQCRRRMGVRQQVELKQSSGIFGPAVCGLWRPTILVPAVLLERLSSNHLRSVLVHELAHVRRADLWVNCLQTALQVLYFYNPLVWLANAIVRRVREQAVDEMSLVALGAEAGSYGHALIDIAEMTFGRASPALRLVGVAESKKSLEGRIKHMITRPVPTSERVGVGGLSAILIAAAVLLPMARAEDRAKQVADTNLPDGGYSILLLDDKDPTFKGKDQYDDRLYLMDSKGRIEAVVTGFNICQTIGGCHALAVDEQRKTLWVAEHVGGGLWHFDLAEGKLLRQIPVRGVTAVAVDPATGNVWCTMGDGRIAQGGIRVFSPAGELLATHAIPGFDIAYSRSDSCFWIVDKEVTKVSPEGKVLGRIAGQIPWYAVSVSLDQKTGNAWVVVRAHPQVPNSRDELWIVDRDVQIQKRIDLEEFVPSCVAVDSQRDVVWVGCGATTLRFTSNGEKLKSARQVGGFSVVPGASADSVIATNPWGMTLATVEEGGYMRFDGPPQEVRDLLSASQKWVAIVPWTGTKLPSSSTLADPIESRGVLSRPDEKGTAATALGSPEGATSRAGGALSGVDSAAARKAYSRTCLANLGKAVLLYANDHADQLPQGIESVRERLNREEAQWLLANAVYLGKDLSVADYPGRAVAYDKTMLAEGKGTNVLYLDSHVDFENSQELERLGISSVRWDAALRTYEVNRRVADFPRAQDFSTPEAAYATINRIDRDDPSAWQKVSVAALAERFARQNGPRKTTGDPEWAKVLSYARIIEVMVWDNTRAAVMAQVPQGMSSQKIVAPIDVRYLERENGRWLNTGNNRFWTVDEAKAEFLARLGGAQRTAGDE